MPAEPFGAPRGDQGFRRGLASALPSESNTGVRSRPAAQPTGKAGDGRPRSLCAPISWGGSRAAVIKGPANAWRPPITPVLTRR